jgi:hypothetical protein
MDIRNVLLVAVVSPVFMSPLVSMAPPVSMPPTVSMVPPVSMAPIVGARIHNVRPGNHDWRLRHDHGRWMHDHGLRGNHDRKRQPEPDGNVYPSCV